MILLRIALSSVLLAALPVSAQKLKVLKPEITGEHKYTPREQALWSQLADEYENGTYDESIPVENGEAIIDSLYNYGPLTGSPGCSWYCGGGPHKVTASTHLYSKDSLYIPDNLHDFNLFTAWAAPAGKEASGAKINFYFEPLGPRLHSIIIYNGYIKNYELWKKNARAKKLKLYLDGKPHAILELEDVTGAQLFRISPVRSAGKGRDLVLTLEVLETYKGTHYGDLVISEINFDGMDVHCFAAGTRILMADNTEKAIEMIVPGDSIATVDTKTGTIAKAAVQQLITANHKNLVRLCFEDNDIVVTDDHPFWILNKGWASVNPEKSNLNYIHELPVGQIVKGDLFYIPAEKKIAPLMDIIPQSENRLTYTLEIENGDTFIANGLLVKTEKVKYSN